MKREDTEAVDALSEEPKEMQLATEVRVAPAASVLEVDREEHEEKVEETNEEEDHANTHACEDFWLNADIEPTYVPDTWEEAREAFTDICVKWGGAEKDCAGHATSLLEGASGAKMRMNDAACDRLLDHYDALGNMTLDHAANGSEKNRSFWSRRRLGGSFRFGK